MLELKVDGILNEISSNSDKLQSNRRKKIHNNINERTIYGADWLGWLDKTPIEGVFKEITQVSERLKAIKPNVLVVIGVGGSYLGTRALDYALSPHFESDSKIEIVYAGLNMSGSYMKELLHYLAQKNVVLNVISKSGSTVETAIGFRILEEYMFERYGVNAGERIVVTTDEYQSNLRTIAKDKGYDLLSIPSNIGGRFSVLTSVGLFPLAMRGHDIKALLKGAERAKQDLLKDNNIANDYALYRYLLYEKGYKIELLASFDPKLKYFHEWWKQLFGESEGKDNKGIFPASALYTTDLHSIGQYVQEGEKNIFETLIFIEENDKDIKLPFRQEDSDKLNYLAGKTLNEINRTAIRGTIKAHDQGGVPVLELKLQKLDEYHLGYLIHFFMKSCTMSAYLLGVNPFDQPGVEAYKTETQKLLKDDKS